MKVAIFDFDGTLFESAFYWQNVLDDFFRRRNLKLPKDVLTIVKPLGMNDSAEYFQRVYHLKETKEEIIREWRNRMGENYCQRIPLKRHAKEYIQMLKKRESAVCLATAMEKEYVLAAMERTGILKEFNLIVTAKEIGCNKNSTRIFEYCMEQLQVSASECTVFEDSPHVAKMCKTLGTRVVGVYDGVCAHEKPIMQEICDKFIESYDEMFDEKEK